MASLAFLPSKSLFFVLDPLFFLGTSILLVSVCLAAVLVAALPAIQELARAARSAEKLFDTLRREFPPTLEAIRLTGLEITELTEEISEGVNSATEVVKQVDRGLSGAKQQVKGFQGGTRKMITGVRAAWKTWQKSSKSRSIDSSRTNLPPNDYND